MDDVDQIGDQPTYQQLKNDLRRTTEYAIAGAKMQAARIAALEAELKDASEAWRAMRHVAVQNSDDPDAWELLISRMDAALDKERAP